MLGCSTIGWAEALDPDSSVSPTEAISCVMAQRILTAETVAAAARGWLDVPWRHQGRSARGVDCAGLVVLVARELSLADHDLSAYGRHAQGLAFLEPFRAAMDPIPIDAAEAGDVLVFADAAYPCHCGFVSRRHWHLHLIHAHASRRKVIEEPLAGEWLAKRRAAFRFRGLATA